MIITQDRLHKIMINYINSKSQFHQFKQNPQIRINTNPRIFNFAQHTKLIKLTIIDHDYNIIGTKPNDQLQKKRLESTKIPIWKVPKIPNEMHEKCMKTWNKMQKEGQKGLTGL